MEGTGSSKEEIPSSKSKHPGAMMNCPPIQLAAGKHDSITDGVSSVTDNSIVAPGSSSIPLARASEAVTEGSSSSRRTCHSKTSPSPPKSRKKKISSQRKKNRTKGKTRADGVDDTATKLGAISVPGSNEDTEGTLQEREEEPLDDGEPDAERGLPDSANQEPFIASARLVREDENDNDPESLPENLEKRILSFVESQLRKNDVVMAEAVTMIPNGSSSAPPGSSAPSEDGKICGMSRWTCRMVAVLVVLVTVAGIVVGVVVATNDDDPPAVVPSPSMTPQTTFAPFSIFDEIPA